ncbi:C2 calcium-dependent membrane targeting [Macleaya cordata]|uniref:Phosphoinositide phospholipase C n=1 Tax=Macleaya cordata TaxID=56857 RepID=A0A200PLL8_MACCD|nr:C2 calcium-dependent membrane targeting [Macleaya cordata]
MGSYKMCMCFTRKFRISEAQPPADVKEAFVKFSDGKNLMTADQLLQFLVKFQEESEATIEDAERVIVQIMQRRHHIAKFTRQALTLDDFHHYLFSDDLNFPINPQVSQDMTAPLSHYFIYTGHNSYLTGNQLSSDCSDVPIIKALKKGVRVIELDIWPNSSKDDVHVLHGRTLTTPVTLIRCLSSIKEYAFCASPYPLVITLEDHLTPKLRVKVAEMLTQTFEGMLFFPESECLEEFPSPEALKHRILISTKPPKEYLEGKSFKEKGKDLFEDEAWGKEVMDFKNELEADDSDRSEHNQEGEDVDECDNKSCQLGAPEYKRLIAIQAKKHKGGLKVSLKVDPDKVGRLSLSEQELEKGTTSHGTDLVRFTQKNLLRVYPKGTRFDSSNYNPLIAWMHGVQMVAFNMQGYGRSLWLMQGMFRSNGECGYVKKPDFLMNVDPYNHVFNPKAKFPVKKTLKVRVYMGDGWRLDFKQTHFDAYSPPDFYVRVGIAGVPADVIMKKTKILEDDWTPVWGEEFIFPLTVPELALLRIEVHEYDMSEKDDFGGQTCLPVWELRPGIRAVPLFNRKGEKFKSVKLLMRFEFV